MLTSLPGIRLAFDTFQLMYNFPISDWSQSILFMSGTRCDSLCSILRMTSDRFPGLSNDFNKLKFAILKLIPQTSWFGVITQLHARSKRRNSFECAGLNFFEKCRE